MMTIEVHIDPNGDITRRRTIETIYVGNVSDLADLSDYVVYDGVLPHEAEGPTAFVKGHLRSLGALVLTGRVVRAVEAARAARTHREVAHAGA